MTYPLATSGRWFLAAIAGWCLTLYIHRLAHPSIRASRRLVLSHLVWKKCASDVAVWCRECQSCCRGKLTSQPAATVQSIPVPGRCSATFTWTLWALFLLLLTGIPTSSPWWDRSSRWLEVAPLKGISASTCADAFISWVSRFGVPALWAHQISYVMLLGGTLLHQ